MGAKEALNIIKEEYPNLTVVECLEFPQFYGFALTKRGDEGKATGGGYITVDKVDGKISTFNPTSNLQLFMSAESIDITKIL